APTRGSTAIPASPATPTPISPTASNAATTGSSSAPSSPPQPTLPATTSPTATSSSDASSTPPPPAPTAIVVSQRRPAKRRAALQGAVIDLSVRQNGLSLRELCGVAEAALRWVRSFGPRADAAAYGRALGGELKVDVHPAWSEGEIAALAGEAVAILDFKGEG